MFKRRQWIEIAEAIILFCVPYLIFWCHFLFASWEWTWGGTRILYLRGCCICQTSLSQTCIRYCCSCPPRQIFSAYSLAGGIGRFAKILPCPHEDGQEKCLSSAIIKFLWLRQRFVVPPELLFTTLFSCPRSRFLYISSSGGHAQWQRQ